MNTASANIPDRKNRPSSWQVKVWSVLIFLSPFVVFGYWMFHVRQVAKAMVLSVPAESLDFGTVWMQDDFEWTIPVTNRSDRQVEILGFDSSCHCTSILPKKCSLAPGETLDLRLAINLAPSDKEASQLIRDFDVLITPHLGDELSPLHTWVVQGRIRSPVELSRASLRFENFVASRDDFTSKTVKIKAGRQVEKIEVRCEEKDGVATIRQVDTAKREYELSVTPSESLPIGPFGFAVAIKAFGKDGQPLPIVNFPVLGRLLANVRAIPPSLDFGSLECGIVKRDSIILSSRSGQPFRVLKVDVEEESGTALAEHAAFPREVTTGSTVFQITQTALKADDRKATITFHVQEDKSKRVITIPVIVSYYGRRTKEPGKR